ncbi:MAG TPA: RagB/SusD family nutrient uptake outer membrane protein [Prolixibacteraceae bacterium]|nr:RagB/SusD family nutrient uptake outer membrane protein [Prolixibacteraceae bacterium]HPL44219.1 RagB/SusD family nutrient uptake outer membrane protein [Prolixibacteraceae bacterium]
MKKNSITMKTGKYIFISFLAAALTISSCQEIIDLEPYNQISETTAFSNPDLIELTVVGMYQAAQRGYFNGSDWRGYPFGAAFVQQGDCRGEDAVNNAAFYRFTYEGTYDPTTANNVYYWQDTYRLINRCNIVVEGVKKAGADGIITVEKAAEYEGEARLLRAAAYHELLVMFARPYKHSSGATHQGVPYYDTPFTTQGAIDEGLQKGRETVAFVYGKILEDLEFAEGKLPLKASRTGNTKISRGTKGAAIAYKVRIYQHMWDMDKVITEGLKLIALNEYALGAQPWTCFASNYTSSEYIFGMENAATNHPGVNAALASQYKRRMLITISPIVWRNSYWLSDDKRRQEPEMVFTTNGVKFTNKYKDDTNYTDASPMMRYAEVLLNLAEAYARKENITEGLKYLNMVRDRSLADIAAQSYTAANFADSKALLKAILAERRIELAMEGRRWPDIHRLQHCPHFPIDGIPAKLANANPPAAAFTLGSEYSGPYGVAAKPYSDFKFVWPIPLVELNANPGLKDQQNPGY